MDKNQQNIMAFVTGKTLTIFVEKTRNEDFCNSIGSSILHIYIYIYIWLRPVYSIDFQAIPPKEIELQKACE